MFDKLLDLFRGVAVHATADQEHEAALEVLLLVMLADGQLRIDEQEEIESLVKDQSWESGTFTLATRFGPAIARARAAMASPALTDALLDDADARIASTVLRAQLIAACRQVADADDDRAASEDRMLARIITRFS
ncbi:MAG: hypothetical protein AB7Q42_11315 [Acidimicrobiia bacterium]